MTAIYIECLRKGCFPENWKIAKILPIIKPGKEHISDPSKYRPISLLNTEGKVLEKLMSRRIMHYLYKTEFLNNNQYRFTPQKSTVDAAMEVRQFIEPHLERKEIVLIASLDVKGAFDSAWWSAILNGLREAKCPRNLYYLTKDYLKNRKAVIAIISLSKEKNMTKGCSQGSCLSPGLWNIQFNHLLKIQYTKHTKVVAFADDILIMIKAETVGEAENIANVKMDKILKWAKDNKIRFNEEKSKVMVMTRRKRKEQNEVAVYVNNKVIPQVQKLKNLGIILDYKLNFREHIKYIADKCRKLIFQMAKSAKLNWGLGHKALQTIYLGGIQPLLLYGAPVWIKAMNKENNKPGS